eukprot:GFUD01060078.1.p1 GENE.GFUD01060078.1~~GFUD01060078.1.p1  ORF type:complete len:524 (+),score=140.01 GFUD01060078.1:207-1778(+)
MKKGFLGPIKKENQSQKENDTKEEEKTTVKILETPKPTGAIPKVRDVPGKKRRRTRSMGSSLSPSPGRGFFVPGYNAGGSSSSMSLSELMDASKGMKGLTNMALAHEIAVDKNFSLTKIQPENEIEKQIKEIMQKAFWDLLKEQLESEPPVYTQAMTLFTEIKAMLYSILLPQHEKLKEKIEGILDIEVIQQQIDAEVLEFDKYAGYILGLMGILCAPVRDDQIAALKQMTEIVPLFKGIMETLEMMKLDMANFTIQTVRGTIEKESKDYERKKFQEFLDTQDDGLGTTREWLIRHAPTQDEIDDPKYKKLLGARILNEAYMEILEWDDYHNLPETLVMDAKRIYALRDKVERASVSTAVILLSFSNLNAFIIPMDSQRVKETVKQHADILLQDFFEDADLLKILPSVAAQVVKDVNDYLTEKNRPVLGDELVKNLTEQLESLEDPNQRIRDLLQKRIVDFCKQLISSTNKSVPQLPPGLTICKNDLGAIAGQFLKLVNYNKEVFGEFYNDIIENHCLFKVEA